MFQRKETPVGTFNIIVQHLNVLIQSTLVCEKYAKCGIPKENAVKAYLIDSIEDDSFLFQ